jgi:hypothetical protein
MTLANSVSGMVSWAAMGMVPRNVDAERHPQLHSLACDLSLAGPLSPRQCKRAARALGNWRKLSSCAEGSTRAMTVALSVRA